MPVCYTVSSIVAATSVLKRPTQAISSAEDSITTNAKLTVQWEEFGCYYVQYTKKKVCVQLYIHVSASV